MSLRLFSEETRDTLVRSFAFLHSKAAAAFGETDAHRKYGNIPL